MTLYTAIIFSADNSGDDITRDGLRCEVTILMYVQSFIYPTDAQLDCSKRMLKFTLKFT